MEMTSKHLHFSQYEQGQGILNTAHATLLPIATAVYILFFIVVTYTMLVFVFVAIKNAGLKYRKTKKKRIPTLFLDSPSFFMKDPPP